MKGFITIKTPEVFDIDKLYELMKSEGKFELPYDIQGKGMMRQIRFPLKDNNVIQVGASKKKINIVTAKASMAKDIGMSALTGGWSDVMDTSKKDNQAILEEIAAEIRRLTGGK